MNFKTDEFTYAARTFTACASDIGIPARVVLPEISLTSSYSAAVRKFKLSRVQRDREQDVQFWEYESPEGPWKIRIYND